MTVLFILILIIALVWLWYSNLRSQEAATHIAVETCRRQGVQLLDGTVALQQLRPQLESRERLSVRRTYQFEYSEDGVNRRRGFVIMHGANLETIGLEGRNTLE